MKKIIPVVLAGGIGERFWPLSRSSNPKQLLPIISKRSMLEETLRRVSPLCSRGTAPVVVASRNLAASIRATLPRRLRYNLIGEPVGKNTAPAVAIAAAWLRKNFGDAVMVVVSADHAISPQSDYLSAVRFAATMAAQTDRLVVFGIRPSRPDTGYGYLHVGNALDHSGKNKAFEVRRFVEKPDEAGARRYVRSGNYLWNSGMFVWKASVILQEFQKHMPGLYRQVVKAEASGLTRAAIDRYYRGCIKESIDYGIMERSDRVAVVRGTFSWDDVGSWEALCRIHGANADRTTTSGDPLFESGCRDTIIVNNSGRALAAVGLENVVLVASGDAVLAISRDKLPKLKEHLAGMKSKLDASLF